VFTYCRPFQVLVPSFYSLWTFTFASDTIVPMDLPAEEIDRRLQERDVNGLKFYDGTFNSGLFCLPRYFREEIGRNTRLSTDNYPFEISE